MISLFLNTSSRFLNIALFDGDALLDDLDIELGKDLSRETLFLINQLLEKNDLVPSKIDNVICVRGPGSFTGLRVGVTIAKVFSYFFEKKLYSISSLEVMALSLNEDIIVPIIDARRGYVYASIFDKDYNVLMSERYIKLEDLKDRVREFGNDAVYVSNDSFSFDVLPYKARLDNLMKCKFLKEENSMTFVPTYLKKTEAEEKLYDNTTK